MLVGQNALVAALAGWSQDVGWRVDGWVSLAALGVLWRPASGTLHLDGPARSGASDLATAARHLVFLRDAGWSLIGGGSDTLRAAVTLQFSGREGQLQPLALTWHATRLPAVQASPPSLVRMPPPAEMLARRAYAIAAAPAGTAAWRAAVIDAAALLTCVPARHRTRVFELLPTWVSDRARARLAILGDGFVDRYVDGPSDQAAGALTELRERWRPR